MEELLITSTVLILALLFLRRVFRNTLSRRVQYALWGLVLIRLLLPVSLPEADFSVATVALPALTAASERFSAPVGVPDGQLPPAPEQDAGADSHPMEAAQKGESLNQQLSAEQAMKLLWGLGMALTGSFFLVSNLRFYRRLCSTRRRLRVRSCRQVYLVSEGVISSPCLFGRMVYITPAVVEDPVKLRHVLLHENTHARHLDPLWAFARCLCLTVYWFDPLVWVAAACSRTDCELACDESVLKQMGAEERIAYGETLLSLIPVKRGHNPMLAATTMTAGKRQLRDRITRIARKPRQLLTAGLAALALAGLTTACTFTGGKVPAEKLPGSGMESSQLLPADSQGQMALLAEKFRELESENGWQEYELPTWYAVTDLDGDGLAELVVTSCQGTGLFSYSYYYEVTPELSGVSQWSDDFDEYSSQPDIYGPEAAVYIDAQGVRHYQFEDYSRNGVAENALGQYDVVYSGNHVKAELLVSAYSVYQNETDGFLSTPYDSSGREITNEQYDAILREAHQGMAEKCASIGWGNYQDLRGLSAQEIQAGLTASWEQFGIS